jgi:hypothetical protein
MHYVACWTEDDGIYYCGHTHLDVRDAMNCLVPDGGSFIRAYDSGPSAPLRIGNSLIFSKRYKRCPGVGAIGLKGGEFTVPLTVDAE